MTEKADSPSRAIRARIATTAARRAPRLGATATLISLALIGCAGETGNSSTTKTRAEGRPTELTAAVDDSVGRVSPVSTNQPMLEADLAAPAQRALKKESAGQAFANVRASSPKVTMQMRSMAEPAPVASPYRERYAHLEPNPTKLVGESPVSTFSIDVDTGAYANVRRFLSLGQLPPPAAVRTEELINYFAYDYEAPQDRTRPFSVDTAIAPAPWASDRHLLRIGIKGYEIPHDELPAANLVFLIDVSGSMRSPQKLGLLKPALKILTKRLRSVDSVAIAVYAGQSGVVLPPTAGNDSRAIERAIDTLAAGGSTNGAAGIELAYQLAAQNFKSNGINRVLLATDGDFNVGVQDVDALKRLIAKRRETGISLTTLGFGTGNFNDELMEQLANVGNGNFAYIDSLQEADKVLGHQVAGTLATIAKDVKIQVEFNPRQVRQYRLLGYENRALKREDFANDRVDAGEIGAGHRVTALYELVLTDSEANAPPSLRYAETPPVRQTPKALSNELAYLKIRYKAPNGNTSKLLQWPIDVGQIAINMDDVDEDFRFATAVAGFSEWLRGGTHAHQFGPAEITSIARAARGTDPFGYRSEFLRLVSLAKSLR